MASRRVEDLYEYFQPLVNSFLKEANNATYPWQTFITDGFRSLQEQNELYAKGRTQPGKIVTNAQGGQSWHNFGLAVDIAFQKDGKLNYDQVLYDKIVKMGKDRGFIWGGDWSVFVDKPHFEWHPGITLEDARAGKRPKGGNMSDEYGNIVYKSTQHDETVKYIFGEDKDPRQTSSKEVQNHIAGLKSRVTEFAKVESEIENKKEQIVRLKDQLLKEDKLRLDVITSLSTTEKIVKTYETRTKVLQEQIDTLAKEKGECQNKLAEIGKVEIGIINKILNWIRRR